MLRQQGRAVHLVREQDVVRQRDVELEAALIALLDAFLEAAVEPGEHHLHGVVE